MNKLKEYMCNGSGGLTVGFDKFKATFAMNAPKNTAYFYFFFG